MAVTGQGPATGQGTAAGLGTAPGQARARDGLGELVTQLHLLGGSATRATLTERLGCGRSVMGYLLHELTGRGVVSIDRAGRPARAGETGRPSHQVSVAPTAPAVIAVELNIDTATVATVGLGGRVLRRDEVSLRQPVGAGELLDRLCALAARQAREHPWVLAIGVAVPSPVRRRDGFAVAPLHLGWPGMPLGELLTARLRRARPLSALALRLGNDANLAALAEHRHGSGRGAGQLLYLTTVHVGLGGALVSGGRLFDGAHGYAMEPGHITVDPAGSPCPCGSTGCLEVEADHRGLLRAAGQAAVGLHDIDRAAAGLLDAAGAGDARALRAVHHVSARLGDGLASLVNLTDPDRIVLAGSLARYYELASGPVTGSLTARSFLSHAEPVTIRTGVLPEAALTGAAEVAFQPLLDEPRATLDARG